MGLTSSNLKNLNGNLLSHTNLDYLCIDIINNYY